MGNGISIIKRCAKCLTQKSIRQAVRVSILSNLDYCHMVWSNATVEITKLQIVKNRVAHLVISCDCRTNVRNVHNCLNWSTVKIYAVNIFAP